MCRNNNKAYLYNMVAQPAIRQCVISAQQVDEELQVVRNRLATGGANTVIPNLGPMEEFRFKAD